MRVFLLTKSHQSERTKLCLQLIARSPDAVVYLAGDAVYCLLGEGTANEADLVPGGLLSGHRTFVCKEDLLARGVSSNGKAVTLDDFYDRLVEDIMKEGSRAYSF